MDLVILLNSLGAGGAEKFLINLAAEMGDRGAKLCVITTSQPEGEFGVELVRQCDGKLDIYYPERSNHKHTDCCLR